jgi:DNA-directed RNA polymerase alpha subunit
MERQLKNCVNGHSFYKSSDCPVCPQCEAEKTVEGFLARLSAPARRALENAGIDTLEKLSCYSEKALLKLHGLGKASLPILIAALQEKRLKFKFE